MKIDEKTKQFLFLRLYERFRIDHGYNYHSLTIFFRNYLETDLSWLCVSEYGLSKNDKYLLFFEFYKYYMNMHRYYYNFIKGIKTTICSDTVYFIIFNTNIFLENNSYIKLLKSEILNNDELLLNNFYYNLEYKILSKNVFSYIKNDIITLLIENNFFTLDLIKSRLNKYYKFINIVNTYYEKKEIIKNTPKLYYNSISPHFNNIEAITCNFAFFVNIMRKYWIAAVIRAIFYKKFNEKINKKK